MHAWLTIQFNVQVTKYLIFKLYHRRAQLGICAHTLSLSLSLSHAGHLNTLVLSTRTIHKCRIKKEIIKRAQFETEIEGQDA